MTWSSTWHLPHLSTTWHVPHASTSTLWQICPLSWRISRIFIYHVTRLPTVTSVTSSCIIYHVTLIYRYDTLRMHLHVTRLPSHLPYCTLTMPLYLPPTMWHPHNATLSAMWHAYLLSSTLTPFSCTFSYYVTLLFCHLSCNPYNAYLSAMCHVYLL